MLTVADANNSSFYENSFICYGESMYKYFWDTLYICTCIYTNTHMHMNNTVWNNDQSSGHFYLGELWTTNFVRNKVSTPIFRKCVLHYNRRGQSRTRQAGMPTVTLWLALCGRRKVKADLCPYDDVTKYFQVSQLWNCALCRNHLFFLNILIYFRFICGCYQKFTPHSIEPYTDLCLTLRRLMSYIYGAPILDVSRSHTTTQHSR